MLRTSERGEGRMSTFIFFALLIAAGLAAWNLIPVYYAHYDFTDKASEAAYWIPPSQITLIQIVRDE